MGLIGSIFSGIFGSNAASHAADTQAAAANNAAQLERQNAVDALNFSKLQYGNSLNLAMPFINTANSANSRLGYLMGLTSNQGLPPGVINPNAPQASVEPCRESQSEDVDWRVDHSERRTSIQPQNRGFRYPLAHPEKWTFRLILWPSPL